MTEDRGRRTEFVEFGVWNVEGGMKGQRAEGFEFGMWN